MSQVPTEPKRTPNRRRQGGNASRNTAQKSYASENDAGLVETALQYGVSPQTPDKGSAAKRGRAASAKQQNQQRTRNNNHKQHNPASTEPETEQQMRHNRSPSHPGSAARGPNAIAFAGATFHASPAPSALPMPSFFKGAAVATESPAARGVAVRGPMPQPSPPVTDADAPTPQRQSAGNANVNDSPLDFMFKAHREEKERQRHVGDHPSAHRATPSADSPFGPGSFPGASAAFPTHRPSPFRHEAASGIDDGEHGRDYGQPMGPAFSTPYQDRIKAARPAPRQGNYPPPQQPQQGPPEDPTEALKKFLFSGNGLSPSAPSASPANARPSPGPEAWPSPHPPRVNQGPPGPPQGSNIQAMENDLRRILRLDSTPSPSTERRLFTQ